MDTNGDWVRCVQWINKIETYTVFCFSPWQDFCEILGTFKSFFQFYFGVSFFFSPWESFCCTLLLQFAPVVLLVVQHTLFTPFLKWMISVISFCLYVMNEMRRNLIKIYIIMSRAIFWWFNFFERFSQWFFDFWFLMPFYI